MDRVRSSPSLRAKYTRSTVCDALKGFHARGMLDECAGVHGDVVTIICAIMGVVEGWMDGLWANSFPRECIRVRVCYFPTPPAFYLAQASSQGEPMRALLKIRFVFCLSTRSKHVECGGVSLGPCRMERRAAGESPPPYSSSSLVGLGDEYKLLRRNPLRRIKSVLKKRLGAGSEEIRNAPSQGMQGAPFQSPQVQSGEHSRAVEAVVEGIANV